MRVRLTPTPCAVALAVLWVSSLWSLAARGDSTSAPLGAAVGVFGEGGGPNGEPNDSGAMQYVYPFSLPSARGHPQPHLALDYNSALHDREAGYGWGLSLPTIEFKPLSGFPRFAPNGTPLSPERYAFDGQPLVLICTLHSPAGSGEECGNEPQPTWTSGQRWRYYRLQVEGLFARFYQSPDRKYWRVQLKGGDLLEFGEPPGGPGPGVEHLAGNNNAIVRWRLVRHSDLVHTSLGAPLNFILYRWQTLGQRGLLYLTDVYDTPPRNGSSRVLGFAHHTQLDWASPNYPQTNYAHVDRAQHDLVLTRVAVASMPWAGHGPREVTRIYRLSYLNTRGGATFDPNLDAPLWHHAFLSGVRMEGRCGVHEDPNGRIPIAAGCEGLPATVFEYQPAQPGTSFGSAGTPTVHGGPPNAVANGQVLPYLNSADVVDFNRDGLPDIIQSWEAEPKCFNHAGHTEIDPAGNDLVCVQPGDTLGIRSARPIIGYLNRGGLVRLTMEHQCMDAGPGAPGDNLQPGGIPGVAVLNASKPAGFLTSQGAATLVGSWSLGVLAWGYDQYSPYVARPILQGSGPSDACDLFNFDESQFSPSWRWERALPDWALGTGAPDPLGTTLRWFADVDGDGLVDRLVETASPPSGDFAHATVHFTRQFAKGQARPAASGGPPVQIPFVFDDWPESSLAPAVSARAGTRFQYVDVNGDGLVDLVTSNPDDNGGIPRVRPGNGRGTFACDGTKQPWPCLAGPGAPTPAYEIEVSDARKPWPFSNDTYFHDVTGDGLADIVRYEPATGEVLLWVNLDGKHFQCITPSCVVGKVVDDLHGAIELGEHRLTFADMNADGVDDLVILTHTGAYVSYITIGAVAALGASSSQPGLLVRVRNGYGATTSLTYRTVQQLDMDADGTLVRKWDHHSPVVASVVTEVSTESDPAPGGGALPTPFALKRVVEYQYREPAYDRWSRTLFGFRKIATRIGDEGAVTEKTYWFGPCQNDTLEVRDLRPPASDAPPPPPLVPRCTNGSDDDDYKAVTGRLVRIDRLIPELLPGAAAISRRGVQPHGRQLLWSRLLTFSFAPGGNIIFDRADRRVTYAYPAQIDTYYYEDTALAVDQGSETPVVGGDSIELAQVQNGRKHVHREYWYDERGNLKRVIDAGAEPADYPDTTTVTVYSNSDPSDKDDFATGPLPCTTDWQCQPAYISIWDPAAPSSALRKLHLLYTASGDVRSIEAWLANTVPLDRHHAAGRAIAGPPPGQVLATGWRSLGVLSYDNYGNLTRSVTAGSASGAAHCVDVVYEAAFVHLSRLTQRHKNGCNSPALETQTEYDRGFEQAVTEVLPNGSRTAVRLDMFGRPSELFLPQPDADPLAGATVLSASVNYGDRAPLSYVDVQRVVGPGNTVRSVTAFNGLGEPALTFDQDDGGQWIISGWSERTTSGALQSSRRAWRFSGDPVPTILSAAPPSPPAADSSFSLQYDNFGRLMAVDEMTSGGVIELERRSYRPLVVEFRDVEQLKSGGLHFGSFSSLQFDGHGRAAQALQHIVWPETNDYTTSITYSPTGEVKDVHRSDARGHSYQRLLQFDTMGRPSINEEPNTGNNVRYAWDDIGQLIGTSDARGCGVNFYYDGLGRVSGEDYSPCAADQPDYTAFDPATGSGLEVRYVYDTYETKQIHGDPTFLDAAPFAVGNLIAVWDRGSHTQLNYDARGRIRRISRQIAAPSTASAPTYDPHTYSSRLDFDLGDRPTRRTTGVTDSQFLVGGTSEESYVYAPSGLLSAISSSYGNLIDNLSYNADGTVSRVQYGDAAHTTADFSYDDRHRLREYRLWRNAPWIWSVATPTYSLPGPSTTQTDLADIHYLQYDDTGNATHIQDLSSSVWPPYAGPVKERRIDYDDLYRVLAVDLSYATSNGHAPWRSPLEPEAHSGLAVPLRDLPERPRSHQFRYDWIGNLTVSEDDLKAHYDRSLGSLLGFGATTVGPNQLQSGAGLQAVYDAAGNLVDLRVERPGQCRSQNRDRCAQRFVFDWDEVGALSRARRYDFDGNTLPAAGLDTFTPNADLSFAYSLGSRVRKTSTDAGGNALHNLEIFDTLQIEHAPFRTSDGAYHLVYGTTHVYPGSIGHVFLDAAHALPRPSGSSLMMTLRIGDSLGSTAFVLDHATGELVERVAYQPYGALESDYRPPRWNAHRELYGFTEKAEDIEIGAMNFGARYYLPRLQRWMSADPATVNGMHSSDLNPYAYVRGRVVSDIDDNGLGECDKCLAGNPPEGAEIYSDGSWSIEMPPGSETQYEFSATPQTSGGPVTIIDESQSVGRAPSERAGGLSERGPDPASAPKTKMSDRILPAIVSGLKEGALNWIDPAHVNRGALENLQTLTDSGASGTSKAIAGAGMVLSVIPGGGEAAPAERLALNAAKGRSFERAVRLAIGASGDLARRLKFWGGGDWRSNDSGCGKLRRFGRNQERCRAQLHGANRPANLCCRCL